MELSEDLKNEERKLRQIIKQERDIQGHIEKISESLEVLKKKEQKAEKLREDGQTQEAEQIEQEISRLNYKITEEGFEQLIRQIRKGEQETEEVLSTLPKEMDAINTGKMRELVATKDIIEEHFFSQKYSINVNQFANYALHPYPNKVIKNGNQFKGNYPSTSLREKLEGGKWGDHWISSRDKHEAVIVLESLHSKSNWHRPAGAILEIAKIGEELIEDLEMTDKELQEIEEEIKEDEGIVERAERNTSSSQTKNMDEKEKQELGEAEQAIQKMRNELQDIKERHKEEEQNIQEYAEHLEDYKQAAKETLEFIEEVKSIVQNFEENRDYFLDQMSTTEYHDEIKPQIQYIESEPVDRIEKSLNKTIQLCNKAEQEISQQN